MIFQGTTHLGRVYSTVQSDSSVHHADDYNQFMATFPDIVRDLTLSPEYDDIPDITKWFRKNLEYNVVDGKKYRGLAVVNAYRILSSSKLTSENLKLANILGWCVEMLQAFYLVHDDIIDGSKTRRGRSSWYRFENNGLNAINDGVLLEAGIYFLLRKYFRNKPYYVDITELFHDVGISSAERHKQAKDLLLQIGHYYQIQDDYLDSFGDEKLFGKFKIDIQEGKCTWPIVTALERANSSQRKKLEECYGRNDPDKVQTVKNIYEEIGLPKIYATYEENTYHSTVAQIRLLPNDEFPHDIFLNILNKLYKRKR
ncbi:hypothetical protein PGB90_004343 [Kerria lacca]